LSEKKPKLAVNPIYLVPVLASLLFGLACAYLLMGQQSQAIPVTPIPETTPGAPLGNALYFVILIAISASIFYLLIKRRSKKIIKSLIVVAMTTAALLLSIVYLYAAFSYLPTDWTILVIPLTIIITVLFDFAIFRLGDTSRNVAVIGLGGALGVFFAFSIPLYSAVVILAFLAVYDIIAVYKGPLKKIAETGSGLDQLNGLSYSFKDIQMGLGDLVFYSMLAGTMLFSFGIIAFTASIFGILAGSILTLIMLEKKGIFPGLPFPILLGLVLGLIVGFLL
jgi:presenilin-like A22 family membrane protease